MFQVAIGPGASARFGRVTSFRSEDVLVYWRPVLVVDDELAILRIVQTNLGRHGFQVETASDGQTGLQAFERGGNRPSDFRATLWQSVYDQRSDGPRIHRGQSSARKDRARVMFSGYARRLRLTLVLSVVGAVALTSSGAAVLAQSGPTVGVRADSPLGPIVTDATGRTLYMFARDTPGVSNCADQCATNWPPLVTNDDPVGADGLDGVLATTDRPDGARQVTYNGWPLYYWARDTQPGDANGQGVGGVWSVVSPGPAPE